MADGGGGLYFTGNNTFTTSGGAQNTISGTGGANDNYGLNLNGYIATFNVAVGGNPSVPNLNITAKLYNGGNSGITKTGDGILLLSNSANNYSGATTVNAGTLAVNGSLASGSAVSVGGASATGTPTLTGSGTVNGSVTINAGSGGAAGTLNPGAVGTTGQIATGPATINGILAIDLDAGSADKLVVTGNLGIAAATLAFNTISAPTAPSYDLASYTGSLDATAFAAVNNLPSGYQLQFDAPNKLIQLVQSLSAYDSWTTTTQGLSGAAAAFDADPDTTASPTASNGFSEETRAWAAHPSHQPRHSTHPTISSSPSTDWRPPSPKPPSTRIRQRPHHLAGANPHRRDQQRPRCERHQRFHQHRSQPGRRHRHHPRRQCREWPHLHPPPRHHTLSGNVSMKTTPESPASKGFALVVTLSLMILLTIIAVGLLTLSSISLAFGEPGCGHGAGARQRPLGLDARDG